MQTLAQSEVLIFKDGAYSYALNLSEVKEIINLRRIIAMPFAAPFLLGLANLRGQVVPVVSPYLLERDYSSEKTPKGRYHDSSVEYASVVEFEGMEIAIACQKIFGVKAIDLKASAEGSISSPITIEGKKVRLLSIGKAVLRASETAMDEQFRVTS